MISEPTTWDLATHTRQPTEAVLERVRKHLLIRGRDYFPFLRGPLAIRIEPFRKASTNPLRRFVIFDGKTQARVIAKWAPAYPNNNEGLTEYLHYCSFTSAYAHMSPALQCPRPLAFLETDDTLLTEEYPGALMTQVLRSFSSLESGRRVGKSVQLSASWLSAFHQHLPSTVMPVKAAWPMIERMNPWIRNCQPASEYLELLPLGIAERFQRLSEGIRRCDATCQIGELHRDFGPSNILVSNHGVTVLDAACNDLGPQLFDVATFTAYLRILPFISPRTERFCRRLESMFLSAYFESTSNSTHASNRNLFSFLVIGEIFRNLDRHIRIAAAFPVAIRSISLLYLLRSYRRILRAC